MKRLDPIVLKIMGLALLFAIVFIGISIGAKAYGITRAPWWFLLTVLFMPFTTVLAITLGAWGVDPNLVFDTNGCDQ